MRQREWSRRLASWWRRRERREGGRRGAGDGGVCAVAAALRLVWGWGLERAEEERGREK